MTQSDRRLLSLIFLCVAVLHQFGNLSSIALICVLMSVGFGVLSASPRLLGPPLPRFATTLLVLALAATTVLYNNKLGQPVFVATFALLALAILLHTLFPSVAVRCVAVVLAAISVTAGIANNLSWGFADIDVFQFQQRAAQALLSGHNPYAPLVSSQNIVPPGVARWIPLHLPYGPILPVLEAPFRLIGDVRLLHVLAALVTAGAVLGLARRAGTLDRAACVVMAFPLTVGMVLFSWVDIVTMAAFAVWMVWFRNHPRVAVLALVIALAAKPTTVIALVPILFWSVRARRQVSVAVVITALFVLPFAAVTGFSQFYYNVLGVQLAVLPRLDALTVNSFLNAFGVPILPFAGSAAVVAAATVLVLRRRPTSYGDLLTGTAVLATVSFLVAKWAYFNYYYIPAVLLMLAVAGDGLALDAPELIRPPSLILAVGEWARTLLDHQRGRRAPRAGESISRGA